ncbi:MAG TPA: ATP-dependent sacrificial sulfur transferase LarE [Candidatus Binatia bacterium]|nr:ATP-dependent sacrificial sulfur transferase LarE [Candidatus Binatia bacterium]
MIVLEPLSVKQARLREIVRSLGSCVVAFSGGVDSALVLKIATDELGERAYGVTGKSASLAERELEGVLDVVEALGVTHEVIATEELEDPNYRANPADRCYYCKHELYDKLAEIARARGARCIVDGFNLDDAQDYRPGRRAAEEFAVRSPLAEAGFTKADVRALARDLDLEVWDKPALACLSSRFPYGTAISLELLRQVERAEDAILAAGIRECRVRHHGDIARIEVPLDELERLTKPGTREAIVAGVQAAGYRYVTIDLGGYVHGNLNRALGGSERD